MATVSLRSQETLRRDRKHTPPVLHDHTAHTRPVQMRPRARRQNVWENILFAAAVAAVLVFCLAGMAQSFYRAASASYRSPLAVGVVLPVTVHPGDTLWTYAQKYGAPDAYILDRVETIARANRLSSDAALVPGQHLRIPVTNPVLVARLESKHRLARR